VNPILEILQNNLTLLFAFFSILLIISYHRTWQIIAKNFHQNEDNKELHNKPVEVSVLVPFRNEVKRILPLLDSMVKIPKNPTIEYIFIDDHSEDETANLISIHPAFNLHTCKIIQLQNGVYGKKNAILEGITKAKFNTIYTTDADCELQAFGIQTLFTIFSNHNAALIIGPVLFKNHNDTLLEAYQKIENTALVALGFYQNKARKPTMANGANLMFNKTKFIKLQPFKNNLHVAGGDDIFTLEAFFLNNPKQVIGTTNPETAVFTPTFSSFFDLWQQRIRWVKKTASQNTKNTTKSQIFLAVFFIIFWGLTLFAVVYQRYDIAAILWVGKLLADIINIKFIFKYFHQPIKIWEIFRASIFQNLFIPLLGLAAPLQKVYWKNRKY